MSTFLHEYAHTVHYRRAGNGYWVEYIEYIIQNGGYGQKNSQGSGIVALGEGWANYLQREFTEDYYQNFRGTPPFTDVLASRNLQQLENQFPNNFVPINTVPNAFNGQDIIEGWIPAGFFYDMTDIGETTPIDDRVSGYTMQQLYLGLQGNVRTMQGYSDRILDFNNFRQQTEVEILRQEYGW